jgi:hypothetical protein
MMLFISLSFFLFLSLTLSRPLSFFHFFLFSFSMLAQQQAPVIHFHDGGHGIPFRNEDLQVFAEFLKLRMRDLLADYRDNAHEIVHTQKKLAALELSASQMIAMALARILRKL